MAARILTRLKFPNDECDRIVSLVANHMRFKDVMAMRASTLKRFLLRSEFNEHLELHRLDMQASNGYTAAYDFVREQLAHLGQEELRPPRLLTGRDLIGAGYLPGPPFSRALEAVETAQLEVKVATKEEALAVARRVLDNEGSGL